MIYLTIAIFDLLEPVRAAADQSGQHGTRHSPSLAPQPDPSTGGQPSIRVSAPHTGLHGLADYPTEHTTGPFCQLGLDSTRPQGDHVAVIGVTGHANLTRETMATVQREIVEQLRPHAAGLIGMTCLARGADQVFADAVLELGGALAVVSPAADYFTNISDQASRKRCESYLEASQSIVTMEYQKSGPEAYHAASRYLIDNSELVLAVWDGSAPTGNGGTSDAVAYARQHGRPVAVIWPRGAQRLSTG